MMDQIIARFPGISCAWTDADGCVTSECYGMADRERGIPVDENTIVAGRAAQVQHAPRREVRPVGPTCRAERKGGEAQGS